jgi:hypothetical protein
MVWAPEGAARRLAGGAVLTNLALNSVSSGLVGQQSKDFFFEKKKQKTFVNFALYEWRHAFSDFNRKKFFGSFFQKRTLLPFSHATYVSASLVTSGLGGDAAEEADHLGDAAVPEAQDIAALDRRVGVRRPKNPGKADVLVVAVRCAGQLEFESGKPLLNAADHGADFLRARAVASGST